jgi:NTE family protein
VLEEVGVSAKTALVLGAGGVTGVAWELGVLYGLQNAGIELATADLVVGTSAGAMVAAALTSSVPLPELYARQRTTAPNERAARIPPLALVQFLWTALTTRDPVRYAQRRGRTALSATTMSEAERLAELEASLPSHAWPARRVLIAAVDAETGAFTTFDAACGAPLSHAVAASCSDPGVWPPVTIGGRRYIDGGIRSPVNADLAAGCERVVVVAPMRSGFGPSVPLASQVASLEAGGAKVAVIEPDAASRSAIGSNNLDPSRRPAAAEAGLSQASQVAAAVREVWAAG